MRKPTREEVDERVASVRLEVMGVGEVMLSPATRKPIVDAVMALLEDKPKPKWEEEFNDRFVGDIPHPIPVFNELKDFIREKLREMYEDLVCDQLMNKEIEKKYGL